MKTQNPNKNRNLHHRQHLIQKTPHPDRFPPRFPHANWRARRSHPSKSRWIAHALRSRHDGAARRYETPRRDERQASGAWGAIQALAVSG